MLERKRRQVKLIGRIGIFLALLTVVCFATPALALVR